MSKNPILNALVAFGYITLVASIMYYLPDPLPEVDAFMLPIPIIAFLSLLVLSVAFMSYAFFYQPVRFLFEQKYKEAGILFISTMIYFTLTAVVFVGGAMLIWM